MAGQLHKGSKKLFNRAGWETYYAYFLLIIQASDYLPSYPLSFSISLAIISL